MRLDLFKHLKNLEWTSYIWLAYLPVIIAQFLPIRSRTDELWVGLSLLFLIVYIFVTESDRWLPVTIPLELGIAGLFSIFAFNNYVLIFPGWQISSLLARYPRKYFRWFATAYYVIIFVGLWRAFLAHPAFFRSSPAELSGLLFPLASPLLANAFTRAIIHKQQLRQTNRRLQAIIQRDERERIARDLHDTLGQSFTMITLKAELAKKLLVKTPERVAQELDDIVHASRDDLTLVRAIVNDLHQQSLSEMLLSQSQNLAAANILMFTNGENEAREWPSKIQTRFSEVMTEAITNIIRHSGAHRVVITFAQTVSDYTVTIQDDGHAINYVREGSNGLTGMHRHMQAADGTFAIGPHRQGTLVSLTLPKESLHDHAISG